MTTPAAPKPPELVAREIEVVPIGSIKPHPDNARVHDLEKIRGLIRAHGFVTAIGVQRRRKRIVFGHGRWEGAQLEGMTEIGVIWLDCSDAEALEMLAADNEASDAASWDPARFQALLEKIRTKARPEAAGYAPQQLDAMIERMRRRSDTDPATSTDEKDPIRPPAKPVTKAGDVWLLGPHRVMCGDCRNPDDVARLLAGEQINVAVTSPPYADRRVYDDESGFRPIPPDEYVEWFAPVAANVAAHLADDGSWFVNIKAGAADLDTELYVLDLVIAHVREWGWHFATEFCWERNGVPKHVAKRFKNQFEPVYQFARGVWKIRPENVQVWSANAVTPYGPGAGDTSWRGDQGDDIGRIGHKAGDRGDRTLLPPGHVSNGRGQGSPFVPSGQGDGEIGSSQSDRGRSKQLGSLTQRTKAAESGVASNRQGLGGMDGDALGKKKSPHAKKRANSRVPDPESGTLSTFMSSAQGEPVAPGEYIGPGLAYPGNRLPTFAGSHEATGHAAAYPVGLAGWFIKAYSDPGDRVFDPFLGSGSTVLAAHAEDRIGFGMELSPKYVDVICQRFQRTTGIVPVLERTGRSRSFEKKRPGGK